MNPFHYAKSLYSNLDLPQQLTWAFALLLLSLVAVMAGVVLIRRAFGEPRRSSTGALPPPGLVNVERHELMGRFWHWSLFGMHPYIRTFAAAEPLSLMGFAGRIPTAFSHSRCRSHSGLGQPRSNLCCHRYPELAAQFFKHVQGWVTTCSSALPGAGPASTGCTACASPR